MDKKDKIIAKKAALVAADQIASNIPALNIAWGLAKGLYGAGMALRQQRALEWVENIRDNPKVFTESLLSKEAFQDGFVFLLEKYIRERSQAKRTILKKIFLDFSQSNYLENYDLDRASFIASQLTLEHIQILSIFSDGTVNDWEKEQGSSNIDSFHNCVQYGKLMLSQKKGLVEYEDENYTFEKMIFLANLGVLVQPAAHWGSIGSGGSNDQFKLSEFGKLFIEYLKK